MAIRSVVTRGFGNGTFSPGVTLVTTRGYGIGAEQSQQTGEITLAVRRARIARTERRPIICEGVRRTIVARAIER